MYCDMLTLTGDISFFQKLTVYVYCICKHFAERCVYAGSVVWSGSMDNDIERKTSSASFRKENIYKNIWS